jgi:ribonucleoside-diphosphate reductase alpha chain
MLNPTTSGDAFVPRRRRLADERKAITHKFHVGPCEGYLTVGLYEDGQPGEIFITLAREGSAIAGLIDSFATAISIGLQYGVPLKVLCNKYVHARYEPSGATQNPNIPQAKSIVDYVFRWLALKFLTPEDRQSIGMYQEPTPSTFATEAPVRQNVVPPAYQPMASFLPRTEGSNE